MADATRTTRFRFWLWLIAFIGVIVPRRLGADWRQEWEAKLQWREQQLAEWDRLDAKNKLALLWYSAGAFADALWLQPKQWEDEMFQDLRFGLRMLLKQPGFTLIAILTLALGIGANTAIFSVVNALLLKPLPFPELERVVAIWETGLEVERMETTVATYLDWRAQNQSFEQLALHRSWAVNLTGIEPPERVMGFLVSPNFLAALGAQPALGRGFQPGEDQPGNDNVAILLHGLWQRRFGGDPNIIGEKVMLNDAARTIIGVTE